MITVYDQYGVPKGPPGSGGGASELDDLLDVAIYEPVVGQVLAFDGESWLNAQLTPEDVGLGNVPNLDFSNPANIVQASAYRFVTDVEKAAWTAKQDALVHNKLTVLGNTSAPITTNPYALPSASSYGLLLFYGPASAGEIDLPAGIAGMNIIIYNNAATAITIDPNGSQYISAYTLFPGAGVSIVLAGGVGNFISLIFDGGVRWITVASLGTITEGT